MKSFRPEVDYTIGKLVPGQRLDGGQQPKFEREFWTLSGQRLMDMGAPDVDTLFEANPLKLRGGHTYTIFTNDKGIKVYYAEGYVSKESSAPSASPGLADGGEYEPRERRGGRGSRYLVETLRDQALGLQDLVTSSQSTAQSLADQLAAERDSQQELLNRVFELERDNVELRQKYEKDLEMLRLEQKWEKQMAELRQEIEKKKEPPPGLADSLGLKEYIPALIDMGMKFIGLRMQQAAASGGSAPMAQPEYYMPEPTTIQDDVQPENLGLRPVVSAPTQNGHTIP